MKGIHIFPTLIAPALFLVLTAGLLTRCASEGDSRPDPVPGATQAKASPKKNASIQSVEVVCPQKRTFSAEVAITGIAAANQKVMVYAMESGFVRKLSRDMGDAVRKNEVLATLDNPELFRRVEMLTARMNGKKSIHDRLQATYDKTPALTPLQLLDDARAEYLSLKAELAAVHDQIAFLQVRSPFKGIITQRHVDEGALVQSGLKSGRATPLFEIQETDPIRLQIPLPEPDAAVLRVGTEALVAFPELAGGVYTAKISRTANVLDPASKTMRTEIDLPNPKGKIKPGMYAKVRMEARNRDNVLSLPMTAQHIYEDEFFLLIVVEGKVKRIPLRKGLSNKDFFEVLNTDVSTSTQVIVKGKNLVQPGQQVTAVRKEDNK